MFTHQRLTRTDAVHAFQTAAQQINAELGTAGTSRQQDASQAKFDRRIGTAELSAFVTVAVRPLQVSVNHSGKSRLVRSWQGTVVVDSVCHASCWPT
ncbi:MAG: hypothetical protein GY801_49825 [bacterium]|nr:hypothetical protein [bacterium]